MNLQGVRISMKVWINNYMKESKTCKYVIACNEFEHSLWTRLKNWKIKHGIDEHCIWTRLRICKWNLWLNVIFFFFDNDWLNVISEDYRSSIWRWLRNWKTNIVSYAINGNLGSNKGLFYELHVIDEEHVSIIQSINMLRS